MGVCPPKMKGDEGQQGQKEQCVRRRGSVESRQRGRKHWLSCAGAGRAGRCPAQAEEAGIWSGESTSGDTKALCHWVSTVNWRGWRGSSKAAHASDLVNIWPKQQQDSALIPQLSLALKDLPAPPRWSSLHCRDKIHNRPKGKAVAPELSYWTPPHTAPPPHHSYLYLCLPSNLRMLILLTRKEVCEQKLFSVLPVAKVCSVSVGVLSTQYDLSEGKMSTIQNAPYWFCLQFLHCFLLRTGLLKADARKRTL